MSDSGEWMRIRLVGDQILRYSGGADPRDDGELIDVRKSLLSEVVQ